MFSSGMMGLGIESTHKEPRTLVIVVCAGLVGLPIARYIDRTFGGPT